MRIIAVFMLVVVFLVFGCKSDSNPLEELTVTDLNGKWIIYHATRNGNVTKSLEKGNFVFQDDSLVSSNLFSTSNNLNFTYANGAIVVEDEPNFNALKVEKFTKDTLILSSRLKGFDMEFYLLKE